MQARPTPTSPGCPRGSGSMLMTLEPERLGCWPCRTVTPSGSCLGERTPLTQAQAWLKPSWGRVSNCDASEDFSFHL